LWQTLPLGPTGYGDSPYAARSAFAGNPLLISLEKLADDGLLSPTEIEDEGFPDDHVEFAEVERFKIAALRRAAGQLVKSASSLKADMESFREVNGSWLEDFALFMAIKDTRKGVSWQKWPVPLRDRDPAALAKARTSLAQDIEFHVFNQFVFFRQWSALRAYANQKGIRFIGDIPIFVALDSADVWANPELFWLDKRGNPTVVAGVPPDYFSQTGQRWGNPLYRWDRLAETGYQWWLDRLRATLSMVDIIRVDHFRGFQASWEVPASRRTAIHGRWVEAPGADLFATARRVLGNLPIVVEDLGLITQEVVELREGLGYPGMRVLQFAFGSGSSNGFLPHNFDPNTVAYTGTHDNDTTVGWYESAPEQDRDYARRYMGISGDDIAWDLIDLALKSVAKFALYPMQDVLSLGAHARMNYPGRPEGNWAWRMRDDGRSGDHAGRLHDLVELYGRTL